MAKCQGKESRVYLWHAHRGNTLLVLLAPWRQQGPAEQHLQELQDSNASGTQKDPSQSTLSVDEEIQEPQKVMCLAKFSHFPPLQRGLNSQLGLRGPLVPSLSFMAARNSHTFTLHDSVT